MSDGKSGPDLDETNVDAIAPRQASSDETSRPPGGVLRDIAKYVWRGDDRPKQASDATRTTSIKRVVDGLDQRELTIALVATLFAILDTLLAYFFHFRDSADATLRRDALSILVAGLIGSLLLLLGTGLRRRALLGFAAFIVGFEMISFGEIQGILYIGFGGWLVIRALKKQKEKQPTSQLPRANASQVSKKSSPERPKASKRYTPPRPSRVTSTRKR